MIKLSILIATIPSRLHTLFPKLLESLNTQTMGYNDIEILGLYDNKKEVSE